METTLFLIKKKNCAKELMKMIAVKWNFEKFAATSRYKSSWIFFFFENKNESKTHKKEKKWSDLT